MTGRADAARAPGRMLQATGGGPPPERSRRRAVGACGPPVDRRGGPDHRSPTDRSPVRRSYGPSRCLPAAAAWSRLTSSHRLGADGHRRGGAGGRRSIAPDLPGRRAAGGGCWPAYRSACGHAVTCGCRGHRQGVHRSVGRRDRAMALRRGRGTQVSHMSRAGQRCVPNRAIARVDWIRATRGAVSFSVGLARVPRVDPLGAREEWHRVG